jgi:hypothetical protein
MAKARRARPLGSAKDHGPPAAERITSVELADILTSPRHVRFTPNNRRWGGTSKSAFGCRFMSTRPSAVRVCTFRQISGLKSQAPTRPITYMRVMRGEGLAGGSAETSLATARPLSSPHGSERHWSARQRLPRSKVSRWFDETVRSHRADNRLGLRRPGRAILASRCLVASAASWRRILANAGKQRPQPSARKPHSRRSSPWAAAFS